MGAMLLFVMPKRPFAPMGRPYPDRRLNSQNDTPSMISVGIR